MSICDFFKNPSKKPGLGVNCDVRSASVSYPVYSNIYAFTIMHGRGLSNKIHRQLQPKETYQWQRKFAKSGGAILLGKKYFYGKKLKSYGAPLK